MKSQETRRKIGVAKLAERNPQWRGDAISYKTAHGWLSRNFPKHGVCEHCGVKGVTDYAFKGEVGKYTRNRGDYEELCRKCHTISDNKQRGSILNGRQVKTIRFLLARGLSQVEAAKRYGVNQTTISRIKRGVGIYASES